MKIRLRHLVIAAIALPVLGFLFVWSGIFNVAASTGHWHVTDWLLHYAMQASVRTHALGVEVPEPLPVDGIQPAAGHFARGCAICHGAPGEPRSPAALAMLPAPPDLSGKVGEWTDAELYVIVKHGVRFTGMPAWPALSRDDEVWAMVAFLRGLPEMDAATYRDLAYGAFPPPLATPASGFEATLADCARCHGQDGVGRAPLVPVIAGQKEAYLLASLGAYASGARRSGVMSVALGAASPGDLARLAGHFARQPDAPESGSPKPSSAASEPPDPALVEAGRAIAERGVPERRIPACLGCHERPYGNPLYPKLADQNAPYIASQLRLFRAGTRGGTDFAHLMTKAAEGLSDDDIEALAQFFAQATP